MSGLITFDRYKDQRDNIPIHIHKFNGRMDSTNFDINTIYNYFKDLSRSNKNNLNLTYYQLWEPTLIKELMQIFSRCGGLGCCFAMKDEHGNIKSFDVYYDGTDPNAYFVLGHEIGHIMNGDCDECAFTGRTLHQEMRADIYAFNNFGDKLLTKPDFFVHQNLNVEGPRKWLKMWRTYGNESIIRQANINRKWDQIHSTST